MSEEPTEYELQHAEQHVAYEGVVDLRKWIDTSAHGFKITLGLSGRDQLDAFDGVMTMRRSRGGQRYHAIIQPYSMVHSGESKPDADQQRQQEWQFAGRGWSESAGAHIAVHLGDAEAIAYWRAQRAGDQVEAEERGKCFYIMLLELDDNEEIVHQQRRERAVVPRLVGGPRSKAVAMMLQDPDFLTWLSDHSLHRQLIDCLGDHRQFNAQAADQFMKTVCGIESKREFDHSERAWVSWETQFHRPFIQWLQR